MYIKDEKKNKVKYNNICVCVIYIKLKCKELKLFQSYFISMYYALLYLL